MSEDPNMTARPVPPMPSQDQEAVTVDPDMLLAQIVSVVGEEFVVMSLGGWISVVDTIHKSDDETLEKKMQDLGVRVVPVSLAPQEEKSSIIMPNDTPKGDGKIITLS